MAAAVTWREFSRQLGANAALVLLAAASWLLMQCTNAFLLDTGNEAIWIALTFVAIVVAILSLVAFRRLEPTSRYFFAPMAATPVFLVLCASLIVAAPLPGRANELVLYALMAGYLGLMIRALWHYVRDRKSAEKG